VGQESQLRSDKLLHDRQAFQGAVGKLHHRFLARTTYRANPLHALI
jgi:hypothetical protein